MSVQDHSPTAVPASDDQAERQPAPDKGRSSQAPAEGADDVDPPLPGSPRG